MGSSREAVFYKVYKEKGETKMSTPYYSANLSNLMANSVLTSSLFDMDNVRMYGFVPEEEDLETNPDYLSIKIHNQIKEKIARDKEAGKFHFSEQEINIMIENALK
jgi:hypothetical protein